MRSNGLDFGLGVVVLGGMAEVQVEAFPENCPLAGVNGRGGGVEESGYYG